MTKSFNKSTGRPANHPDPATASVEQTRTPKKIMVDFLSTILACTVIALLITIFTSKAYIIINLVMSYSVGLSIFLIAVSLYAAVKPEKSIHVTLIFFAAFCGGVAIGTQAGLWILQKIFSINPVWPNNYFRFIMISVVAGSVATYVFYSLLSFRRSKEMIEEERIRRMSVEKDALEAKLRMLQAQIEPHFLFNTLSNVISLIDTQPEKGKTMLLDLTKYLRTSLSRTLPDKTTLGQEMEMIKAYLNIQKIRMDERLNFKINVPDTLRQKSFPPMLLQPLVENAVKHGLEPKVEGGEIVIRAVEEDSLMRIEVADTGMGISDFDKSGVGLTNVRERLAMLFGDRGKFCMEENHPSGIKAIIEVPIDD